jgi:hypothetical protein
MDASSISRRAAAASVTTTPSPYEKIGRYRWKICALLFFATTMNYVDRQAVALLKPVLQNPGSGIGLTEVNYGYIVTAFSLAYCTGPPRPRGLYGPSEHKNRLRGCSRGLDPGRRTGIRRTLANQEI